MRRALSVTRSGYQPPERKGVLVFGEETLAKLRMKIHSQRTAGTISDHDALVSEKVAWVLAGGNLPSAQEVTEDYLLRLEREAFASLCTEPKSLERMDFTLKTGKPLRN